MPPENKMTDSKENLAFENALLRNNDFLMEKWRTTLKEEIAGVNKTVSGANQQILDKMLKVYEQQAVNTKTIELHETRLNVHDEKFKSLKSQIAVVGTISASAGGAVGFFMGKVIGG